MVKVLIGWEIGGGQGHVTRIVAHRQALESAGHEVVVALRRRAPEVPDAIPAAVWGHPPTGRIPTVSLGDVLINMGAAVPGAFKATVEGWSRILDTVRPDCVVADFAPALLVASCGRAKTILIGNGYDCPPSEMDAFPSLVPGAVPHDERIAAEAMGLSTVPSAFAADHVVVGAIPWIDPYGGVRPGSHLVPRPQGPIDGGMGGVFAYVMKGRTQAVDDGLAACGVPVRQYVHGSPTPWSSIATSRVVVSHGGCGFVTQAALCGIPQVVIYPDLEKRVYAEAVASLGLGIALGAYGLDARRLADAVVKLRDDRTIRERCRRNAVALRSRPSVDPVSKVVDLCSAA